MLKSDVALFDQQNVEKINKISGKLHHERIKSVTNQAEQEIS